MNKQESELILTQNNFSSVIILSLFYSFFGLVFYVYVKDAFVLFIIGCTNFIGVMMNVFSAKNILIYNDKVLVKKIITKRKYVYDKKEVFFSNTYGGMYSLKRAYGFSIKTKINEAGIGLIVFKSKQEQNEFYDKIKALGYSYKFTGW